MLPKELLPEKTVEVNDLARLQNLLEDECSVGYVSASLHDLDVRKDGRVVVGGEIIPFTRNFLEDLAKSIEMPLSYAYRIDFDLFKFNVEERKRRKDTSLNVCVSAQRAVALAPADYRPARTADILGALPIREKGWVLHKAVITDRSMEIDLLSEEQKIEPQPGDEIRVGMRISNSETGGPAAKASYFTHRLVCTNGAVMSDVIGTARWAADRRVAYLTSVRKFVHDLMGLHGHEQDLAELYNKTVSARFLEEEFVRLWRRLRTGLPVEAVDRVLGIDASVRRALQESVSERAHAGVPAQPGPWTTYDIHNRITAAAKTFPAVTRSRLERIGGDVLVTSAVINNN